MTGERFPKIVSCISKHSWLLHLDNCDYTININWSTFCLKCYNFLCCFFNRKSVRDEYGEGGREWEGGCPGSLIGQQKKRWLPAVWGHFLLERTHFWNIDCSTGDSFLYIIMECLTDQCCSGILAISLDKYFAKNLWHWAKVWFSIHQKTWC